MGSPQIDGVSMGSPLGPTNYKGGILWFGILGPRASRLMVIWGTDADERWRDVRKITTFHYKGHLSRLAHIFITGGLHSGSW
jgi:hypothetical protein